MMPWMLLLCAGVDGSGVALKLPVVKIRWQVSILLAHPEREATALQGSSEFNLKDSMH